MASRKEIETPYKELTIRFDETETRIVECKPRPPPVDRAMGHTGGRATMAKTPAK